MKEGKIARELVCISCHW